jgi:hypothetical protein
MLSRNDKDLMIYLEKYHALTIKQAQRLFYKSEDGYNVARKRLRELEKRGLLNSYLNLTTSKKVYYMEDHKVSAHDLYIMDFYSMLVEHNCENIKFKKQPRYLKGLIIPDGFFSFEYNDSLYFILLEVDLTHITTMGKFQMYEKLFKEKELQNQCFNIFPLIVVMGFDGCMKYESHNFEVIYSDFDLSNFESKILGIA